MKSRESCRQRKEDRVRGRVEVWILPGEEETKVACDGTPGSTAEVGVDVDAKENLSDLDVSEVSTECGK